MRKTVHHTLPPREAKEPPWMPRPFERRIASALEDELGRRLAHAARQAS